MKIRTGFVSNSSSSSFILSVPKHLSHVQVRTTKTLDGKMLDSENDVLRHMLWLYVPDRIKNEKGEWVPVPTPPTTIQELLELKDKEWGREEVEKTYKRFMEIIHSGKSVFLYEASNEDYEDDGMSCYIHNYGFKNVEFVQDGIILLTGRR